MRRIVLLAMATEAQTALRRFLDSLGVTILTATTRQQLWEVLSSVSKEAAPKVIVTADVLPDGTWTDVLDRVQRNETGALVIVTSRIGETELWCEVVQRGAYDLLPEPYDRAEVERLVHSAFLNVRSRRPGRKQLGKAQTSAA